jgi:uncharacterized RDD family membrane protein YckC
MENEFTTVMQSKSDEELILITTVNQSNFRKEALEAANIEFEKRNIDPNTVKEVQDIAIAKETELKKIDDNTVNSGIRFVNYLIDFIAYVLAIFLTSLILGFVLGDSQLTGLLALILPFFGYYIFLENKYQKTAGKYFTKTKVVMKDGSKPELNDIVRRTFCRLIPLDHISFLFTRNGFHDNLSDTMVVKDEYQPTDDEK